jgi:hypothetical protein
MKPATRTLSIRVIAASFAAAGAIFGGLAVQMAHGHDPALGTGTSTAQTSRPAQTNSSSGGSSFQDQSSQPDQSGSATSGVVTRAS